MHRDVKPDNIFIDGRGDIKIGDFGYSKNLEEFEQDDEINCGDDHNHK